MLYLNNKVKKLIEQEFKSKKRNPENRLKNVSTVPLITYAGPPCIYTSFN